MNGLSPRFNRFTKLLMLAGFTVSAWSLCGSTVLPLAAQDGTLHKTAEQWRTQLLGDDLALRREAAIATRSLERSLQRELLPALIEGIANDKDGQVRLGLFATLTDMGPDAAAAVDVLADSMRRDRGGGNNEKTHQDYRAALALASIGRPAVEALRGLLTEKTANDRSEAAMALGRIGPDAASAVDDLIRLLEDGEERVRHEAANSLGNIGTAAVEPLLKTSTHESQVLRAGVIAALAKIPVEDDRHSDAIQLALRDDGPDVRAEAVRAIDCLNLTPDDWQSIILESLRHTDEEVRMAAINSVLAHRERIEPMSGQLVELMRHDDDGVAEHAAYLLHVLGPGAIEIMLSSLERDALSTDRNAARVRAAAHAISLIGPSALDPLYQAIGDTRPQVRQAAALAMGEIRPVTSRTVDTLAAGLQDSDRATQEAFLESIGSLAEHARSAAPAVQLKLDDPSPAVRAKAIDVLFLVAQRDQALVVQLINVLNDPDQNVQLRAIDTLRALGPLGRHALPVVIGQLQGPSMEVRRAAAVFIGSQGTSSVDAVEPLIAMLAEGDVAWRLTAVATLGQIGTAARPAFDQLQAMLDDPDSRVRRATVDAATSLGVEPELLRPFLARALHDADQEVRGGALRIMRRIGDDAVMLVPDIIPLAAIDEERRGVLRVLERLERSEVDPLVIGPLRELLSHEHAEVRRLAIRFLGLAGRGAAESLPSLRPFVADPDESIRSEAESAIEKIEQVR